MRDLYLAQYRYRAALARQSARIGQGLPFDAVDDDTPGNKYTHASWGLCSREQAAWPDRNDHLWPDQFDEGRVAPKYRKPEQRCPLDKRTNPDGNGCFYTCRIFKGPRPDRQEAIRLYDEAITASTT
jgi:hypothetical protein